MESSPSLEANTSSVSQESHRILMNPKVRCHTHKNPPPVPILSEVNPVHASSSYSLNIHFNITLPRTPAFQAVSFPQVS